MSTINIEDKIKPLLAQRKMSIGKLAVMIGTTKQTLHAAFNRNDLKLSQLEKISEILEVSVGYFFQQGNEANEPPASYSSLSKVKDEQIQTLLDDMRIKNKLLEDCLAENKRLKNGTNQSIVEE